MHALLQLTLHHIYSLPPGLTTQVAGLYIYSTCDLVTRHITTRTLDVFWKTETTKRTKSHTCVLGLDSYSRTMFLVDYQQYDHQVTVSILNIGHIAPKSSQAEYWKKNVKNVIHLFKFRTIKTNIVHLIMSTKNTKKLLCI